MTGRYDDRMPQYAVTVVGHDRPGIIARTAGALARVGMNLADSSMTLLRGHFAMTLICDGDATPADLDAALGPIRADQLDVTIREVPPGAGDATRRETVLISVHGADRLGIVSEIAGVLAGAGANITDLSTRLSGSLYVLTAEVDLAAGDDPQRLLADLHATADRLRVEVSLSPLDDDEL